jgi:hypothetical protein
LTLFRQVVVAAALGLLVALLGPALALAQTPADVAARTAELSALTAEARRGVAALGSDAPSATLIAAFARRGQLLQELAELDPSAALSVALTPAEVASLPPALASLAERWVYRVGHVGIVHEDRPGGAGGHSIFLVENGVSTELRLAPSQRGRSPSEQVLVGGIQLASDGPIVSDDVIVLASPASASPLGPQRTALLLANAAGAPAHPYANKVNTASLYFSSTSGQSLRAFISEASYGQATVVGGSGGEGTVADVFGPYNVPLSCSTTVLIPSLLSQADPEMNLNNYDRIVVLLNHPSACSYAGIASVGAYPRGTYDGATQFLSYAINVNAANGSTAFNGRIGGTALHEYGHNLGLYHAWTVSCGATALTPSGCTQLEYNDPSDVMGRSASYGHYNAVYKEQLGWLTAADVQTVAANGAYTLRALEGGSGTRALKVPWSRDSAGNPTAYYYVEYRVPPASWRTLATTWPSYDRGVLLHVTAPEGAGPAFHSQLVDTKPSTHTNETTSPSGVAADPNDAPLRLGETYVDNGASLTITVNSADAAQASLQVNLTPATITAGVATVAPGGTLPVSWSGIHAPSSTDWFALFATTAPNTTSISGRRYLNCAVSASGITAPIPSGTCNLTVPPTTPAGTYELRLFPLNSTTVVARSATITVAGGAVPTATSTVTPTRSPTMTRTITPTRTRTLTRTITPTRTITQTRTITPTRAATLTRTPSRTRTITPTRTRTATRTVTPTGTTVLTSVPTQTRTRTATRTPANTRTSTVTRTPVNTRTITPTRTATPIRLRATWQTRPLTATLAPGQSTQLNAVLSVTSPVDQPAFLVQSRSGSVSVDPSSLPARLDPGQSYTIRLNATMPGTVAQYSIVALVKPGGSGTVMEYLTIWLLPTP